MSSSRAMKILFLSFKCEDIGVAMVTNMITNTILPFLTENLSIIVFISPL